jgi:hypothetical protein
VLSAGRLIEGPPDVPSSGTGEDLSENKFLTKHICHGETPISVVGTMVDVEADLTNCTQKIDGIVFHDSHFTGGELSYFGAEPLLFAESNVVSGTTLSLGPNVDTQKAAVRHLICAFPWKAVYLRNLCTSPKSTAELSRVVSG